MSLPRWLLVNLLGPCYWETVHYFGLRQCPVRKGKDMSI